MIGLLSASARQAATLRETAHRPWPLPSRPWLQGQTWERLLFAHWRADPADLLSHLPSSLAVDVFDGSAWVGVTPFRVVAARLRGLPPPPLLSSFLELNVRTYATVGDKPGIWFFSLDAESRLAVEGARRSYRLPYHHARMRAEADGDRVRYRSRRRSAARPYAWQAAYEPTGPVFRAAPGSLEHFLTERYCLYSTDGDGRLLRADIHHPPWPLQGARAEIETNTMAPDGVTLSGEPLLHLAALQDVVIWSPEPAEGGPRTGRL